MKKTKNGPLSKEKDLNSSKGFGKISDDEDLDGEIIDLEDIVELGFSEQGKRERIDLDQNILDADGDLDLSDLDEDLYGKDNEALEEDLLKELAFDEELDSVGGVEEDSGPPAGAMKPGLAEGPSFDAADEVAPRDLDDDLDLLFEEEEKDDFEKLMEKELSKPEVPESKKDPHTPREEPVPVAPPVQKSALAGKPSEPPDVEGIVDQIESRLIEAVREMVEARLPSIVEAFLREEIEKLKKELA